MRARIYQRLKRASLLPDLDLGDAFALGEETILEGLTQINVRELLELRSQLITIFPDALIEREKLFQSEPMYLSLLVTTSAEKHLVTSALDQMGIDGLVAAWEDTDQERHPSLRWMLTIWPRSFSLPHALQGYMRTKDIVGSYHLRVMKTTPNLVMVGINDSTGRPVFSTREENDVITLDFSLDLGERLLLWCSQGQGNDDAPVATAMLHRLSRLFLEKEDGISIHHLTISGGFSQSP